MEKQDVGEVEEESLEREREDKSTEVRKRKVGAV